MKRNKRRKGIENNRENDLGHKNSKLEGHKETRKERRTDRKEVGDNSKKRRRKI